MDTLTITPVDKFGNKYLHVIINLFTKFVWARPSPTDDAEAVATALFVYFSMFGMYETIITDPGTPYKNEIISHLNRLCNITHYFSLVDRHQSNGTENSNKEILRHIKALCMDERLKDQWSGDTVLPAILHILNSHTHAETGVIPFHAMFGSQAATYGRLPDHLVDSKSISKFLKLLDYNLQYIRDKSIQHQNQIIKHRAEHSDVATQNQYQTGDFVLFKLDPTQHLPSKLHSKCAGPYEVLHQYKNDVSCRDLIDGSVKVFHVERLKIFVGTLDLARRFAQVDKDQYTVNTILAWRQPTHMPI